ncbi:TIGR04086 family membrane protein [Ruminococcus flavefaciens]|uniref:Putative membrane protein, TIGR04086 family n=1 Tax=Ruminococcus flavefaciens TaxID=1265 RepID=A0A1M7KUV4_RUMFL|nr:TIGR04086 family membrane protein [Ruminococcus flavefaciens]SHM69330.1 putative membrane protein, TIGR04086 family [Ruminococcus flavefaciens]
MRRQRKSLWSSWIFSMLISVMAGAVCMGAAAFFSASAMYFLMKDTGLTKAFAGASLAAGAYTAAYICGKYRRRKGLICGTLCGVFLYVIISAAGIMILGQHTGIKKLLLLTVFGAAGGVAGVNSKRPEKLWDQ